jgi:hypothetical protein
LGIDKKMSKEELIQFEGLAIEILPDARYGVQRLLFTILKNLRVFSEVEIREKLRAAFAFLRPKLPFNAISVKAHSYIRRRESSSRCRWQASHRSMKV